jgi:hypothetical protein
MRVLVLIEAFLLQKGDHHFERFELATIFVLLGHILKVGNLEEKTIELDLHFLSFHILAIVKANAGFS